MEPREAGAMRQSGATAPGAASRRLVPTTVMLSPPSSETRRGTIEVMVGVAEVSAAAVVVDMARQRRERYRRRGAMVGRQAGRTSVKGPLRDFSVRGCAFGALRVGEVKGRERGVCRKGVVMNSRHSIYFLPREGQCNRTFPTVWCHLRMRERPHVC